MKSEILFYIAVFFRRFHYFLAVFLLVAGMFVTMAKILPPVFLSETTLLLESSQIPTSLAAPTVNTGAIEELQIVEKRLMTRNNLLQIARDLNVFDNISEMTTDQIVQAMTESTKISLAAGRSQADLMTISFESDSGSKAASVLNRYVTIVLQENAESRASRAGDTLEFFEREEERLALKLEEQSAAIVKFQNESAGALPSTLAFRLNQQTVLQTRLTTTEREVSLLADQRRRLVEIYNATGRVTANTAVTLSPDQVVLDALKADLRRARAIYSSENPKVKLLEAQIEQQELIVTGQPISDTTEEQPATLTILDINLTDLDARMDILQNERQQIFDDLDTLIASINRTAEIDILLSALNREYTNIQRQYDTTVDRLSKAAAAERIELLSKGRRITVLIPATVPLEPDSPNRLLIAGGGTILGALLGLALIVGLEMLNSSIRRPVDITNQLGVTPLATVPYIRTPMEMVFRRAVIISVFFIILFGVPAVLLAVHTYYLPLDILYEKVAAKLTNII